MSSTTTSNGRFRPFSSDDFLLRAKHAAWLFQTPLQATQEWLAKLYGYSGLHEIRRDLKKRAANPDQFPAGPTTYSFDRAKVLVETAASLKGLDSVDDFSDRDWSILNLGMFDSPVHHRISFQAVKSARLILDAAALEPKEYATVGLTEGGRAFLWFSPVGRAIFDAVNDICEGLDGKDAPANLTELEEMIAQYPANPWVRARYVITQAETYGQRTWNANIRKDLDGTVPDGLDPELLTDESMAALRLLPQARVAVAHFEKLYGEKRFQLASHDMWRYGMESGKGADAYYYPALLYFAGMIAMNAGELALAQQWLHHHNQSGAVRSDDFDSRYPLSALNLVLGTSSASGPFGYKQEDGHKDSWLDFIWIAENLRDGKLTLAKSTLIRLLARSPHALRAIDDKYRETDSYRVASSRDHIRLLQEFFHCTKPFWDRHPDLLERLRDWVSSVELRNAYKALHDAQSAAFRLLLKPVDQRARLEESRESAVRNFNEIGMRLMSVS